MGNIGAATQEKMHWVPAEKEIYLVMDKARGHGDNEAIREYKAQLKEKHNVVVNSQCSRSPETNALHLSMWMCLQSQTEKLHFKQRSNNDALARSVREHIPSQKHTQIFSRIPKVLQLIISDEGGNDLVEQSRGHLTMAPGDEVDDDAEEGGLKMLCNRVQKRCRIIPSFYVVYFTRASHGYKHTQSERYGYARTVRTYRTVPVLVPLCIQYCTY